MTDHDLPDFDAFPPDLVDALGVLRAVAKHVLVLASYEVRPYDTTLDRRRWRWQRAGCWRSDPQQAELVRRLTAHLADPPPRGTCRRPPAGWWCSLDDGHVGPCPGWPEALTPRGSR